MSSFPALFDSSEPELESVSSKGKLTQPSKGQIDNFEDDQLDARGDGSSTARQSSQNERRQQTSKSRISLLVNKIETTESELQNKKEVIGALIRRIKHSENSNSTPSRSDSDDGKIISNVELSEREEDDPQYIRSLEKKLASLTNAVIAKNGHINDLIMHICEIERDQTDMDEDDIPSNASVDGDRTECKGEPEDAVLASQIIGMSIKVKCKKTNKFKKRWDDRKKQILLEAIAEVESESSSDDETIHGLAQEDPSLGQVFNRTKPLLGLMDYVCYKPDSTQ